MAKAGLDAYYKGIAIKVNKVAMSMNATLCLACGVFMGSIEFVPGAGADIDKYCTCCNANLAYATSKDV